MEPRRVSGQVSVPWAAALAPDHVGQAARAWRVDLSKIVHPTPDTTATLASWFVNAPGAHLCWSWWVVSVIHLRPIPGVRPAHITRPNAMHELIVFAQDPDHALPDPRSPRLEDFRALSPIDVSEQFMVPNDADAAALCEQLVKGCCDGRLSPDQDYRRLWAAYIQGGAQHVRAGLHRGES